MRNNNIMAKLSYEQRINLIQELKDREKLDIQEEIASIARRYGVTRRTIYWHMKKHEIGGFSIMSIDTQLILMFELARQEFIEFELEGQFPESINNRWD